MNFCIRDFGLNKYSWIHILFPGWLYYVCIWGFLPSQLGKKPCRGGKTHTERKMIVVLYLSNLLKKHPFQHQAAVRKQTCLYKAAGCWSVLFNSVCHVFSLFPCPSHQDAASLACGMQQGDLSHWLLQLRPLQFMFSLQSTGLLQSAGLQLPLGSIYMSATTDSDSFPEGKRCIDRELRYKSFPLGAFKGQKRVKIEWG